MVEHIHGKDEVSGSIPDIGFREAKFILCRRWGSNNNLTARAMGLEPTAFPVTGECSNQLSYARRFNNNSKIVDKCKNILSTYGIISSYMAKFEKRIQALKLRRLGKSIGSIAQELGVSKSTSSHWCMGIKLTKQQKETLTRNAIKAGSSGRLVGAEMNKRKKQERIEIHDRTGLTKIGKITSRELLIAGIALYWAEGSKTDRSQLSLVNSDPILIYFMYQWFQKIFNIPKKDFLPRVSINEIHRPRIEKVTRFWAQLLKLPLSQFRNTSFIKAKQKKVYENYDLYYGVLSLRIRKSTDLKYQIRGLIKALGVASG